MTNPIAQENERRFADYCKGLSLVDVYQVRREDFDCGWEAALETTAPIIEAAIATWRLIEKGTGYAQVEGLGGAGKSALQAAENWMAVVKPHA